MKQLGRRSKTVAVAGVSAAVLLGGGAAAYGAGGTGGAGGNGSAGGTTAAPSPTKARGLGGHAVFGKVSAVTAPTAPAPTASGSAGTGGTASGSVGARAKGGAALANAGSISLTEPDGSTYTADVLNGTKVFEYVAPGKKPVAVSLSAVHSGDEVALYVRDARQRETGASGSGTASGGGTSTTPTTVHVVTRILDLTGAVPAPTTGATS